MQVIKLSSQHIDAVRPLFDNKKYMGIQAETKKFVQTDKPLNEHLHEMFIQTYLSDLKNYHAYGVIDNGIIQSFISFYESIDDASWYWHHVRSFGNNSIKPVLDKVIEHNEERGRFKFYSMFPSRYVKTYRRLAFSKVNNERYDYFDEFYVPEKHVCIFTLPYQILYTTLLPIETTVRCSFLKQKYRKPFNAGNL